MWKVSNITLKTILERYQTIIDNFFVLVIELSKNAEKQAKLQEDNYLLEILNNHAVLDSRLLNINKSATDKIKPLIEEIIMLDSALLEDEYNVYNLQNNQINNGNYNLTERQHPISLVKIFKDYFYEQFFGIDWIWSEMVGRDFSRSMFKDNFKTENKLNVCPYCDVESISISRNSWIEHFLPKSKFPYLSCNPNNLMPSCTACNVSGTGKGEDVKNPIANQYNIQIGDRIKFEFDGNSINISHNDDDSIENFIELLKIRQKYHENSVRDSILSVLKINYNTFLKINRLGEFQEDLFFDFIHDIGREKGFYFVQKDILSDINEII